MKVIKRISRLIRPNPITTMNFSSAGMHGLPVEIWDHIFGLVTTPVTNPFNSDHELQTAIPPSSRSPCESRSILTDFFQTQQPAVFQMRLSIVLVCKSWYFIGITALQSHVTLRLGKPFQQMLSLRRALDENPHFASSVVRLSITGSRYGRYGWYAEGKKEPRRVFAHILSRLTHLKIITCPYYHSDWIKMARYPEVCIIHCSPAVNSYNSYEPITTGQYFWHQSQTLVFGMKGDPYQLWKSSEFTPVTFPNLVNLSLRIEKSATCKWITTYWDIPNLRSLTINSTVGIGPDCLQFVARFTGSLEHLELFHEAGPSWASGHSLDHNPQPVVLPKLKSFCVAPPLYYYANDLVQQMLDHIRAPGLKHFAIQTCEGSLKRHGVVYIRKKIGVALGIYQTVKSAALYYGGTSGDHLKGWKERGVPVEVMNVITRKDIWSANGPFY